MHLLTYLHPTPDRLSTDQTRSMLLLYEFEVRLLMNDKQAEQLLDKIAQLEHPKPKLLEIVAGNTSKEQVSMCVWGGGGGGVIGGEHQTHHLLVIYHDDGQSGRALA